MWYGLLKIADLQSKSTLLYNKYKKMAKNNNVPFNIEIISKSLSRLDPTSPRYQFLDWITGIYAKNDIIISEDSEKIYNLLKNFIKLKRSPNFHGDKNINSYKTVSQLYETIMGESDSYSKNELKLRESKDGYKIINRDGEWQLISIFKYGAAEKLCAETNWCIQYPESFQRYVEDYGLSEEKPLYMFVYKNRPFALMHIESQQFMDFQDRDLFVLLKMVTSDYAATGYSIGDNIFNGNMDRFEVEGYTEIFPYAAKTNLLQSFFSINKNLLKNYFYGIHENQEYIKQKYDPNQKIVKIHDFMINFFNKEIENEVFEMFYDTLEKNYDYKKGNESYELKNKRDIKNYTTVPIPLIVKYIDPSIIPNNKLEEVLSIISELFYFKKSYPSSIDTKDNIDLLNSPLIKLSIEKYPKKFENYIKSIVLKHDYHAQYMNFNAELVSRLPKYIYDIFDIKSIVIDILRNNINDIGYNIFFNFTGARFSPEYIISLIKKFDKDQELINVINESIIVFAEKVNLFRRMVTRTNDLQNLNLNIRSLYSSVNWEYFDFIGKDNKLWNYLINGISLKVEECLEKLVLRYVSQKENAEKYVYNIGLCMNNNYITYIEDIREDMYVYRIPEELIQKINLLLDNFKLECEKMCSQEAERELTQPLED